MQRRPSQLVPADLGNRISRAVSGFWLRAADSVGEGAIVTGRPFVSNGGSIVIGKNFHLSSRPVQSHLAAIAGGKIEIGDNVLISYGAAVSAHREVRIGDDTRIGPFTVIMDGDYHRVGDRSAAGDVTPVRIGKGVVIGTRVTVLRGSDIGDGARVESGSVVSGAVAPGAVVGGVPARPLLDRADDVGGGLDIADLMMRVLGLADLPKPSDGPDQIPQWDSLGTLRLLLAVEETFGVALGEEDMRTAKSVARLSEVVSAARARAGTA